jgi:oligoribonuclease
MAQDQNHLIWLDMEMTGLNPDSDRIIEMAMVVTNSKLDVIAEGPVIAVHQPDAVLDAMDEWNKNTHGRSGLIERSRPRPSTKPPPRRSTSTSCANTSPRAPRPCAATPSARTAASWPATCPSSKTGSTTATWMCPPSRSSAAAGARMYKGLEKKGAHQALADIHESIAELRYYREHFLKV